MHSLFGGAVDSIGVVTFTVAGQQASVVAAALSAEHGIGVRDGAFCAHPLVRQLLGAAGCAVDDGGQALRASVGLGTTTEHVQRLVAAVESIASSGPAGGTCWWTVDRCPRSTTGPCRRSPPGSAEPEFLDRDATLGPSSAD